MSKIIVAAFLILLLTTTPVSAQFKTVFSRDYSL